MVTGWLQDSYRAGWLQGGYRVVAGWLQSGYSYQKTVLVTSDTVTRLHLKLITIARWLQNTGWLQWLH